jgi:DNA-binding MarR family transcriptional regulator
MRDLIAKHLVRLEGANQGQEQIVFHTTPESDAILDRIDTVRRDAMNDALSGWAPETHEELRNLISRLTQDLAASAPA